MASMSFWTGLNNDASLIELRDVVWTSVFFNRQKILCFLCRNFEQIRIHRERTRVTAQQKRENLNSLRFTLADVY